MYACMYYGHAITMKLFATSFPLWKRRLCLSALLVLFHSILIKVSNVVWRCYSALWNNPILNLENISTGIIISPPIDHGTLCVESTFSHPAGTCVRTYPHNRWRRKEWRNKNKNKIPPIRALFFVCYLFSLQLRLMWWEKYRFVYTAAS